MPLYGRTDHFQAAVRSVLAQDSPDWRLLVIDDHNPDPDAASWYRDIDDPRLEYRRTPANLGPGPVFQLAAESAEAARCTIMGCDDILLPGYVRRVGELAARAPGVSMIQPGVRVIGTDGSPRSTLADTVKSLRRPRVSRPSTLRGDRLSASLLRGNWLYFPSISWSTDDIQRVGFRPDRHIVQDLTLELELILGGGRMLIDAEPVFLYRRHDASASARARVDGSGFIEAAALYSEIGRRAADLGWRRTRTAARTHITSRISAALSIPHALAARDAGSARVLARHALSGDRHASRIRA